VAILCRLFAVFEALGDHVEVEEYSPLATVSWLWLVRQYH
jgi:hypothetical protein